LFQGLYKTLLPQSISVFGTLGDELSNSYNTSAETTTHCECDESANQKFATDSTIVKWTRMLYMGVRCPYLHAPWSWNTVDWKSIWGGQFPWNQKIDHDVFHLISHKLNVACRQRMMFSFFKPKWNIVWNLGMVRHEKWIKHNWFCEIWPHCYQTYFAHGARHAWLQCGWQV
jgi:hypothetical protein